MQNVIIAVGPVVDLQEPKETLESIEERIGPALFTATASQQDVQDYLVFRIALFLAPPNHTAYIQILHDPSIHIESVVDVHELEDGRHTSGGLHPLGDEGGVG